MEKQELEERSTVMKKRCCFSKERRLVQNEEQNMLSDDSVNAVEMRCLLTKRCFQGAGYGERR